MDLNPMLNCASLGSTLKDKIVLSFFGLVAPRREGGLGRWRRRIATMFPTLWLRPARLNGLRLLIDPTNWSQTLIFEEVFLRSAYDLSKVKFKPDLILDCGAHIGIFSVLAKSTFPGTRLIAYEPNPQNIQMVRSQVAGNNLDVKLVESAISVETKELLFSVSNSHNGRLIHEGSNDANYKVQAINFPEVFKQMKPESLLLKMDVEGEERSILPLLVPMLPRQSALFFETHGGDTAWHEIDELLKSNGFQVEQLSVHGGCCDGFACRG